MVITTTCSSPNQRIAIDVCGPWRYPEGSNSAGHNLYCLSILCDFSKFVKFVAIPDLTSNTIARALVEEWILNFGIPREILSDNAPNSIGEIMTALARYFGISQIRTSIAHPQSNGSVEKAHLRLAEFLRATESELEEEIDWAIKLKMASHCMNTTVSRTTSYSPHELMFGYKPRLISSVHNNEPFLTPESYVAKMRSTLAYIWEKAKNRTVKKKMEAVDRDKNANTRRKEEEYRVGQLVLVRAVTLKGKTNRTVCPYLGPWPITQVNTHTVKIAKRNRETTVNKCNIKPFITE